MLPDGCRDVIVRTGAGVPPSLFYTALDQSAYQIHLSPNTHFIGVRLFPGVKLDERVLSKINPEDSEQFYELVFNALSKPSEEAVEVLEAISSHHCSVSALSNQLAVSERTIRRLITREIGWSPSRWISLARVRNAAKEIVFGKAGLAEIAYQHGFADQPHMSREVRRWFQRSPLQMRGDRKLMEVLAEPGFS